MKRSVKIAALAGVLLLLGCPTDTVSPVVTIVLPVNGAVLAPGNVTIKAVATDNKSVVKVEFFAGTTKIGEDATGTADTFDISWTAAAGSYTLKAVAWDGADNSAEHSIAVTIIPGGGTGPTHHSGEITQDETWYPSGNPHIIDSDVYTGDNVTLTIKPGCIIRFAAGTELYCGYGKQGAIIAEGTPDSVILFTSNAAAPAPGDWHSVGAYGYSMANTSFKHCIFEYGGSSENYGMFAVENSGVKISHCTFRHSSTYGIRALGDGYFRQLDSNTVTSCASYPVDIGAEYARTIGTGNNFTGNGNSAVKVRGGRVRTSGTWVNPGVPYVLTGDVEVGDNSLNPVLTIAPGTTIQLGANVELYCGYTASGGLVADGTQARIRFTSSVPAPSRGDWYSLGFYSHTIDAVSKLVNCTVEYGGGDGYGNIRIQNALPTVTGDSIGHSAAYGIHLSGSEYPDRAALLANNYFYDNASGDVNQP